MDMPSTTAHASITVVGVGGAGCNAINRMIAARGQQEVAFIAVNTDNQVLATSLAPVKVRIGDKLTKGLGAGGNPDVGAQAAEENKDELHTALVGADMVFVTAGMGGGTGTGAAPVVAEIAQGMGALTVGVVTTPFSFEGQRRRRLADEGISVLKENVDALITVPNDRLLQLANKRMNLTNAFALADEVLRQGIQGISDTITVPGLINVDFADITSILAHSGSALMGIGSAWGDDRAVEAARVAVASPLLDVSMEGATGVLFIVSGADYTLFEVNEAAQIIREAADPEATVIFGAVLDPSLHDELRITVIATGFDRRMSTRQQAQRLEQADARPQPALQARQPERTAAQFDVPSFLRKRS